MSISRAKGLLSSFSAVIATAALVVGMLTLVQHSTTTTDHSRNGLVRPTSITQVQPAIAMQIPAADQRVLATMASTEAGRARLNKVLNESFGSLGGTANFASSASSGGVTPVLAYGYDNGHFWVTASYADMARGAIWVGVQVCKRRFPPLGGLCQYLGNTLTSWSRGWGSSNAHGVWAAVYLNGRFTGGRW